MGYKSFIASKTSNFIDYFLRNIGDNFKSEVLNTLSLSSSDDLPNLEIVCPDMIPYDSRDIPIITRILNSYNAAKEHQKNAPSVFLPSSLWQNQLDSAYESLYGGDMEKAGFFLSNFGAWPKYTGIENTRMILDMCASHSSKRQLRRMIGKMVNWWKNHESQGRSIEALSYPRFGNQYGAALDGNFIGLGSVFNDVHSNVIANIITNMVKSDCPIIAEIGGGYGKLFYFITRKIKDFTYLNFDLPETICCSAYYLMKVFPDKKFLLFGEEPLCAESITKYDFILMPSFCIEALPSNSIDIFLNKNSLGEMAPQTTRKFISEIERTTNFFWHINHELMRNYFDDNTSSLLNSEYELSKDSFCRIIRYLDIGHAIYQGSFDSKSECYSYLYGRHQKLPPSHAN